MMISKLKERLSIFSIRSFKTNNKEMRQNKRGVALEKQLVPAHIKLMDYVWCIGQST